MNQLEVLFQQLAMAAHAGLPLREVLEILRKEGGYQGTLLAVVGQRLDRGATLSEALSSAEAVFSRETVEFVRAAEDKAMLPAVLDALALDYQKKQVRTIASNMGHLLWSRAVPDAKARRVARALLSREGFSGWGIRTVARGQKAYNPLSYHNGTVWPHDSALAVWGLARHGYVAEARRIARALIEAAAHFDWSLPEVFAGYARDETPFPIAYPTAARPQAWAAGTPILLVRVLLGIEPDRMRQRLISTVTDELPSWLDGLRIEGVRAYGRTWTVAVERGHVTIAEGV